VLGDALALEMSTNRWVVLLHDWFFQRRVHCSLHRVSRRSVLVLLDEVLCSGGGKERFQIGGVNWVGVAKAFAQKGPPHGRPLLVFSSGRYWTRTSDHSSMETSEDFYPQIGLMLGRSNCA
jgi:hypothetical protein